MEETHESKNEEEEIPEKLPKIIKDLTNDILTTFPEYKENLDVNLKNILEDNTDNDSDNNNTDNEIENKENDDNIINLSSEDEEITYKRITYKKNKYYIIEGEAPQLVYKIDDDGDPGNEIGVRKKKNSNYIIDFYE